jgi:hypothetical protein
MPLAWFVALVKAGCQWGRLGGLLGAQAIGVMNYLGRQATGAGGLLGKADKGGLLV